MLRRTVNIFLSMMDTLGMGGFISLSASDACRRKAFMEAFTGGTLVWPGELASCMRACIRFMSFLIVFDDVLFCSTEVGSHGPGQGLSHPLPQGPPVLRTTCTCESHHLHPISPNSFTSLPIASNHPSLSQRSAIPTCQTGNPLTRQPCHSCRSNCRWLVRLPG